MAKPRTRTDVFAWGLRQLGDEVVVVELKDSHVEDAWDDAILWFVSNRGIERTGVAQFSGPGQYTLPEDVDTVLEVAFPATSFPQWGFDANTVVGMETLSTFYGGDSDFSNYYSTLIQWMQRAETSQKIMSQDPLWEWRSDVRILLVFPSEKALSGTLLVRYVSSEVYDEDPVKSTGTPNDLRRMPAPELNFILKYFVAGLKLRLGRIRSKFADGMPSAGGKALLDGDVLISEAKEEFAELTELLGNYGTGRILTG